MNSTLLITSELTNQRARKALFTWGYILKMVMHQSIPAVPIPSPPGNRGAFPNVASPDGRAFAYLGSTPGHLAHLKPWSESRIRDGGVYRPRRRLRCRLTHPSSSWMFLKVYFLNFRSPIERLKTINPGVGHLPGSFIPTPGNLPIFFKEMLMPGG